jgi:hypothetical protein
LEIAKRLKGQRAESPAVEHSHRNAAAHSTVTRSALQPARTVRACSPRLSGPAAWQPTGMASQRTWPARLRCVRLVAAWHRGQVARLDSRQRTGRERGGLTDKGGRRWGSGLAEAATNEEDAAESSGDRGRGGGDFASDCFGWL